MGKKKKPLQPPPLDDGHYEFFGEHDDPADLISDEEMEALNLAGDHDYAADSIGVEAMEALIFGDAVGLAHHLRQIDGPFSELLRSIADCLDTKDQGKLRLKFVAPKGRPADKSRIFQDGALRMQVHFALHALKTDKLEAAIQDVSAKSKVSRSRVRRAWDSAGNTKKKATQKKSVKPKL